MCSARWSSRVGPDAKLTLIATYNGTASTSPTTTASTLAQLAQFGKYFGLNNDPKTSEYYGYNHTHKTTDFEIVKFEANLSPHRGVREPRLHL